MKKLIKKLLINSTPSIKAINYQRKASMMNQELLDIKVDARFPYRYSMGTIPSYFFQMIRDEKRIMGKKCPRCGTVYVPPRPVCGPCYEETGDWVEVGPKGTLVAYTVVYFTFLDPMTGKRRPVPY